MPDPSSPRIGRRISRRGLLGYAGTTGLGAAAGAGLVVAAGGDSPAPAVPGPQAPGATVSPWGAHQPGVAQHPPAVTEVVARDLRDAGDRAARGRLVRVWAGGVDAVVAGVAAGVVDAGAGVP